MPKPQSQPDQLLRLSPNPKPSRQVLENEVEGYSKQITHPSKISDPLSLGFKETPIVKKTSGAVDLSLLGPRPKPSKLRPEFEAERYAQQLGHPSKKPKRVYPVREVNSRMGYVEPLRHKSQNPQLLIESIEKPRKGGWRV